MVISIIVILILAGVSVVTLTGDNGILKRATDAKEMTEIAKQEEQEIIEGYETLIKEISGDTIYLSNYQGEGTKPYLPTSKFSVVRGTNLTEGLVITDEINSDGESTGNEYVWIEVPSSYITNNLASGKGPDYSSVTGETDYTHIEDALIAYAGFPTDGSITYSDNTGWSADSKDKKGGWKDEYYEGCGLTSSEYSNLYHSMLTSVYKNGGFWIGRYEAGTTIARGSNSSSIDGIIPISRPNQYPINYVTCSQAQIIASRINNIGKYNSSLMFGVQWDLVIKHLSNKGVSNDILKVDSSTWGNYNNQQFTLDRGKYCYASPWNSFADYTTGTTNKITVDNGISTKLENQSILLTTGASNVNLQKNIYDLAGNEREWTLERSTWGICFCVTRGGYFGSNGLSYSASSRDSIDINDSKSTRGLRVSIY